MRKQIVVVLVLLLSTGLYAADFATQLSSQNRLSRSKVIQWTQYSLQSQKDSLSMSASPLNANFFKSALIPGWGQFSQEKYVRTGVFLGIEATTITGYTVYDNKYQDRIGESHAHAEKYWHLDRWLNEYNVEADPRTHSIHIRFIEQGHNNYGDVYSYPGDDNYPSDPETNPDKYEMVWDKEGYENAYKYDQFAMGWFDPTGEYEGWSEGSDNTVDDTKMNELRRQNKNLRDTANGFAETSTAFIYGMLFNHLVSAFETVLFPPHKAKESAFNFHLRYVPTQVQGDLVNTLNLQLEW